MTLLPPAPTRLGHKIKATPRSVPSEGLPKAPVSEAANRAASVSFWHRDTDCVRPEAGDRMALSADRGIPDEVGEASDVMAGHI